MENNIEFSKWELNKIKFKKWFVKKKKAYYDYFHIAVTWLAVFGYWYLALYLDPNYQFKNEDNHVVNSIFFSSLLMFLKNKLR